MISTDGKMHIRRYMAGFVPSIAGAIAFGLGDKAESVNDNTLQFEVGRSALTLTSYDFSTNKLIFKAPVPTDYSGTIYEVGLYSTLSDKRAGTSGGRLIATFDSNGEAWIDNTGAPASYTSALSRIGGDALSLSAAASATVSAYLGNIALDFSADSNADRFILAYNVGSNVASVALRFKTDASNYYQFNVASPTATYHIDSFTKGAAIVTGSPNWASISTVEVVVTATAGGTGSVTFDGIRMDDYATQSSDYVMVSRELLAIPFVKATGVAQEVEFTLDVVV